MAFDWQSATHAYNRDNKTNHTVKELLMSLYPKHSSQTIGKILFVSPQVVLNQLQSLGIKIEPKGRREPTKWDKFMAIPSGVFSVVPEEEIASMMNTKLSTIRWYKSKRLKRYKYYKGKIGVKRNPPQINERG